MKKVHKMVANILIAVTVLIEVPFRVSAAETQIVEQIYAAGDYNVGSIYGPQLKKTELDQVAQAVLTFVESYDWTEMDDFTKVYCAHQYLCDICDYAPDWSKNRANTAWGALVYGEAQCSGYARAFKALCDAIGIGCYYVHADENAWNPDHQWNEVCVDGVWYIIDVQCNDASGFPAVYLVSGDTYAYCFGMSWNHDGLPECTRDYFYGEEGCGRTSQEVLQTPSLTLQDIPMGNGTRETIPNDAGELCYVNEYDENGNLIKTIDCNADGSVWYIGEYEGDSKYTGTCFNADGTIDWYVVSEYIYEENVKHEKATYYNADGTIDFGTVSAYTYDECGNEVEYLSYYDDGIFNLHIRYEYDVEGKKVKSTYYNEDGALNLYMLHEYDENGKNIKDAVYDAGGRLMYFLSMGMIV